METPAEELAYTAGYRAGYLAACHGREPPPGVAAMVPYPGSSGSSGAVSGSAALLAPLTVRWEISQGLAKAGEVTPGQRDPPRPPLPELLEEREEQEEEERERNLVVTRSFVARWRAFVAERNPRPPLLGLLQDLPQLKARLEVDLMPSS